MFGSRRELDGGSVAIMDIDGDGDQDLLVGGIGVFFQDEGGDLSALVPLFGSRYAIGDIDGDNDLDLAFANGTGIFVVLQEEPACFGPPSLIVRLRR